MCLLRFIRDFRQKRRHLDDISFAGALVTTECCNANEKLSVKWEDLTERELIERRMLWLAYGQAWGLNQRPELSFDVK